MSKQSSDFIHVAIPFFATVEKEIPIWMYPERLTILIHISVSLSPTHYTAMFHMFCADPEPRVNKSE